VDFLVRDAHGPQHAELLPLIGTLVDNIDEGGTADPQPLRVVRDECIAVTGERRFPVGEIPSFFLGDLQRSLNLLKSEADRQCVSGLRT
jgi:hypothetical protein